MSNTGSIFNMCGKGGGWFRRTSQTYWQNFATISNNNIVITIIMIITENDKQQQ